MSKLLRKLEGVIRYWDMRLIFIIVSTLAAVFLALTSIHFYGKGQPYQPYSHHFLGTAKEQEQRQAKKEPLWLLTGWENAKKLESISDLILVARVYKSGSGLFLVAPSKERIERNNPERALPPGPERPLLADFLKMYPQQRLVLEITDNLENIDLEIAEALKAEARSERILIQSDYNLVLESIKHQLPALIYGSTESDTMRLKSFQSLGILTAVPFKGDVYFSSLRVKNRDGINKEIAQELQLRYKPVVFGPLANLQQAELALGLGADGLYFENSDDLLQWLSQHPR